MELSREEVLKRLAAAGYVADPQLAVAITLMRRLQRPLLLEGEAGVGKTEVGKALTAILQLPNALFLSCITAFGGSARGRPGSSRKASANPAREGRFDHVLVGSTGILEPLPAAEPRLGRRTALTFPLLPPPQKN
jgi:hypothetical protein